MTASLRSAPSGPLFGDIPQVLTTPDLTEYYVDPTSGDDGAVGDAVSPLQSLAEVSRRLFGALITDDLTVYVLGTTAETDRLTLNCFSSGQSQLTVRSHPSAVTDVSQFTIVTVTQLPSGAANYAFELETTGIDWTAQTARRIVLPTGQVGWVAYAVDANNVRVSGFMAIENQTLVTPSLGVATLQSSPQIVPPTVNVAVAEAGRHNFNAVIPRVVFRDLSIDLDEGFTFDCMGVVQIYGSILRTVSALIGGVLQCKASMIEAEQLDGSGTSTVRFSGGGELQAIACLFTSSRTAPPAPFLILQNQSAELSACFYFRLATTITAGCSAQFSGAGSGYFEEQYAFAAVSVERGSVATSRGTQTLEGSVNGAAYAFVVNGGGRLLYTVLPAVTGGSTSDCDIGGTDTLYAGLPAVNANTSGIALLGL